MSALKTEAVVCRNSPGSRGRLRPHATQRRERQPEPRAAGGHFLAAEHGERSRGEVMQLVVEQLLV